MTGATRRKGTGVDMSMGVGADAGSDDTGFRADHPFAAFFADGGRPMGRQAMAIALTVREGADPFALVANTLEEEPCDGVLPLAGEAHFAWRDRLGRLPAGD